MLYQAYILIKWGFQARVGFDCLPAFDDWGNPRPAPSENDISGIEPVASIAEPPSRPK